jgi:hypothetical protein
MPANVRRLTTVVIMALCAYAIGVSTGAAAQGRFELLGGDAIANVQGLRAYTIRDGRTAVCYTVFVLAPLDAESSTNTVQEPILTSEDLDKIRVAGQLKAAGAERDRQIAALRSSRTASWTPDAEAARQRIDDEYERVVRTVLPRLYPPAPISPGWRWTSVDALNEAARQAIAEADAVVAGSTRSALDAQLLDMLHRIIRSRTLAVAGPMACAPAAAAAK